jgi:RHS repeat-associated protein
MTSSCAPAAPAPGKRKGSGKGTHLLFNLEGRVGGQAKVQYTWSPAGTDTLVLRDRDTGGAGLTERLWVQQDVHGDVTALISGSGQVVERYLYSPYGEVLVRGADWSPLAGSAYGWRYLFQGGRYEGATGLYNFRARDNSPSLGVWLRPDPLGFGGGNPASHMGRLLLRPVLFLRGDRLAGQAGVVLDLLLQFCPDGVPMLAQILAVLPLFRHAIMLKGVEH